MNDPEKTHEKFHSLSFREIHITALVLDFPFKFCCRSALLFISASSDFSFQLIEIFFFFFLDLYKYNIFLFTSVSCFFLSFFLIATRSDFFRIGVRGG